jgi:ankyrin repeat protein
MPAALLYTMFKSKTQFPLHAAIKSRREDVVFLYLIENDSVVSVFFLLLNYKISFCTYFKLQLKLNEVDEKNDLPLDLSLRTKQESIARNLVRNHADVNKTDSDGLTLLHKAIIRSIIQDCLFDHVSHQFSF